MKKPLYRSGIITWVFLSLGLTFPIFGYLSYVTILKPTPQSKVQDPHLMGLIFYAMGGLFLVATLLMMLINYKREKLRNKLILNEQKIVGHVEKISLLRSVSFGTKNPYQVHYTFWHEGNEIHKKSHLLWEKPSINVGDTINVYINEKGQVACDL